MPVAIRSDQADRTFQEPEPASLIRPVRFRSAPRLAPYLALVAVAGVYLALTLTPRYEVVADELAAFGAGMRIYLQGALTANLVEQLFVNPYLVAGLAWLVGVERSFVTARWIQGIVGLLTILATFELGRRLTGRPWLGVLAATLLTASPFYVDIHHRLRMDNPETLAFVLTQLALAGWVRRPVFARLGLVLAATVCLVASKLLGLLFVPGLLGVAVAWRLRCQGGLALVSSLIAALWLGWVLPQVLVLRLQVPADRAQTLALMIAGGLVGLLLIAFRGPIARVLRAPRPVLVSLGLAAILLALLAASPLGRNRAWTQEALINYQLQRFTVGLDEGHPGNQERFPEGFTWYLREVGGQGTSPVTLALAGLGIVALVADRRRPPAGRLIRHRAGGLIVLLPLVTGFAFLAGSRSWFLRYSLPLFPSLALLAALGTWAVGQRLATRPVARLPNAAGGLGGLGSVPRHGRFGIGLLIVAVLGLLAHNISTIRTWNQVGEGRATFFSLREPFGQQVQAGELVLADHKDSWIYDSRLFFQPWGAYPLMMLGVPRDVQLTNIEASGPILADWLITDYPVESDVYQLVFTIDRSNLSTPYEPGAARYFVYRNANSVAYEAGSDGQARLTIHDLRRSARVQGGHNAGGLVRWTLDGRRHWVIQSHPGTGRASEITIPLAVQPGDWLRGSYGFNPDAAGRGSDGATVRIRVNAEGRERLVHSDDQVRPPARSAACGSGNPTACRPQTAPQAGWSEFAIDLTEYAGQSIQIVLETGPGPAGDSTYDWTGWADLRIVRQE